MEGRNSRLGGKRRRDDEVDGVCTNRAGLELSCDYGCDDCSPSNRGLGTFKHISQAAVNSNSRVVEGYSRIIDSDRSDEQVFVHLSIRYILGTCISHCLPRLRSPKTSSLQQQPCKRVRDFNGYAVGLLANLTHRQRTANRKMSKPRVIS